jgi:hypothetical protein
MTVRITVADETGTTSFVSPGHAIKMFVAACSEGVDSMSAMLRVVRELDEDLVASIKSGLAQFDEHNLKSDTSSFEQRLAETPRDELPPFRVYNPVTRDASLSPARLGLILFNLKARRIVQVQNHYGEIRRMDRGRIRRSGEPSRVTYAYRLPSEWSLVP